MNESTNKQHLSVVIPIFGCAMSIIELTKRIKYSIEGISPNFEIIYVNDRSLDNSWNIIGELAKSDQRIKGVLLSRNFGQHAAITAGLEHSNGDWVIVMDGDLQDRPEEIPRLYEKATSGYELVVAVRKNRMDSARKQISSRLFNYMMKKISDSTLDHRVANFGIYSRKVVNALLQMKEQTRTFALLAEWVGFTRMEIEVEHSTRKDGYSAYTFSKSLALAIETAIGFSSKILRVIAVFGFVMSFVSFGVAFVTILRKVGDPSLQLGWTSIITSIFLTSGLIVMVIGIVGLYIAKTFAETKNRPIYLVESMINVG
jgi:glycosyltransferase involved in cell wall biosynthesis